MQKIYFLIVSLFFITIAKAQGPLAKKIPTKITKHNITIDDYYAWLENVKSNEVTNWVNEQNIYSENHLKEVTKATNFFI
jgi:prolyl oligopeptidase